MVLKWKGFFFSPSFSLPTYIAHLRGWTWWQPPPPRCQPCSSSDPPAPSGCPRCAASHCRWMFLGTCLMRCLQSLSIVPAEKRGGGLNWERCCQWKRGVVKDRISQSIMEESWDSSGGDKRLRKHFGIWFSFKVVTKNIRKGNHSNEKSCLCIPLIITKKYITCYGNLLFKNQADTIYNLKEDDPKWKGQKAECHHSFVPTHPGVHLYITAIRWGFKQRLFSQEKKKTGLVTSAKGKMNDCYS